MKETDRTSGLRVALRTGLLLAVCLWAGVPGSLLAKAKPLTWKPIDEALLSVNGEPPKDWTVSEISKKVAVRKGDELLIQLDGRFFLVEAHDHRVFQIDPATIKRQGEDLLWSLEDKPAQPIPSEWTTEDLGSAFRLAFTLPKESLSFDLQILHPPDYGDLPAHNQAPETSRRRGY